MVMHDFQNNLLCGLYIPVQWFVIILVEQQYKEPALQRTLLKQSPQDTCFVTAKKENEE